MSDKYVNQVRRVLRIWRINHRGCSIELTENGYLLHGRYYATKEEIDEAINEEHKRLEKSLNRIPIKTNQNVKH
jgi:hypothetical protein